MSDKKIKLAFFLIIVIALSGTSIIFAQKIRPEPDIPPLLSPRCATMEMEQYRREKYPHLGSLDEFETWIQKKIKKAKQDGALREAKTVIKIPVVVHVIHNNEAVGSGRNISDAQIISQITVLNEDYRRLLGTPGWNGHPDGADVEIEFCMAQRDEDGLSTDGIKRYYYDDYGWGGPDYSYNPSGTIQTDIKPDTIWDPTQYMNMWTVSFSDGTLGYAQFPDYSSLSGLSCPGTGADTDGLVMAYDAFGDNDPTGTFPDMSPPYDKGRTATHEIGHWLGLRHPWGDGDCTVDDFCNDTPNCMWDAYAGVPFCLKPFQCGNDRMIENYMDYSDDGCMNIFTQDQKTRIWAVMMNSPRRIDLLTSAACNPPTGDDAGVIAILTPAGEYCSGTLTPQVVIKNFGSNTLFSVTVNYKVDGGTVQSTGWSGSLLTYETATKNLTPDVSVGIGAHTFQAYTTSPNGSSDGYPSNDSITENFSITNGTLPPITEGFEGEDFPPQNWEVNNIGDDCYTWVRRTGIIGSDGNETSVVVLNAFDYQTVADDELILPVIDLRGYSAVTLSFDVAYAYNGTNYERLRVEVSEDCGSSYDTRVYDKDGTTGLQTGGDQASFWIPTDASHWRNEIVGLSVHSDLPGVVIKFRSTNGNGNNLFIDNISITAGCVVPPGPFTWEGNSGNDWNVGDNWDLGCVPGPSDNVIIPSSLSNYPEITAPAYVNDLTIETGAYLEAAEDFILYVYGNWEEQGDGYFDGTAGTVCFKKNGAQTITQNGGSQFYHLMIGDGVESSVVTANTGLDVDADFSIMSGATFNAGSLTHYVGGDWDHQGTFNPGTSTFIFDSGSTQTASGLSVLTTTTYVSTDVPKAIPDRVGTDPQVFIRSAINVASTGTVRDVDVIITDITHPNDTDLDIYLRHPGLTFVELSTDNGGNGNNYRDTVFDDEAATSITAGSAAFSGDFRPEGVLSNLDWKNAFGTWYLYVSDDKKNNAGNLNAWSLRLTVATPVTTFNNLTVTAGSTVMLNNDMEILGNLLTESGGILDLSTYEVSVTGSVTNNGGLRQTKTVSDGVSESFLNISTDKYYGVEINPTSGDMGSTTVTVFGDRSCFTSDTAVLRCFELQPETGQTADITFYYLTSSEANGQSTPNVWHYYNGAWVQQTYLDRGTVGSYSWIEASCTAPYSPFSLSDANPNPTGVTLVSFQGRYNGRCNSLRWETATELDTAGFNVYRSRKSSGEKRKINRTLIPAQGLAGMGSIYKFRDCRVRRDSYFYWVEEISNTGSETLYGPIQVKLKVGVSPLQTQPIP
ncbi:M43 family zinc metalloprotease [candidate division CSSED10-310 bacterium]|uniref:M43 family zinc metalloprotease n=1 Tax=candidate division CSSED10-310 bacterium TaxID=2855610 RepID=A0ABV6YSF3_UNCC1